MKVRNRFVLLLDLFLIILSVLGWIIVTSGCETDKRIVRLVSVYPLCEAICWSFPLGPRQFGELGSLNTQYATRTIHPSAFILHPL